MSLTGQGLNGPALTVSPSQAKHGNVTVGSSGSQTFTLGNAGDAPLRAQPVHDHRDGFPGPPASTG